jgi:predicted XRE-type DNA-binding protein
MSNNATEKKAVFAEEGFVVDAQIFLNELMIEKSMSRADLAKAMGVSRARISQLFSDDCTNFTVRLLARAIHAMGEEAVVTHRRQLEALKRPKNVDSAPARSNVVKMWAEDASNDDCVEESDFHWFEFARAA